MTDFKSLFFIAATVCALPITFVYANNHENFIDGAKREGKVVV